MTGQRVLPGLGLSAYWTKGSGNWDVQHDPDTRKLSVVVQCAVKNRVAALPAEPANGDIYLLTAGANQNQIAARDNGEWIYYAPSEGWLVHDNTADTFLKFTGTQWQLFQPGTVLPAVTGQAGKVLKVNAGATGLVWADDLQGSGGGGEGPATDPIFLPHLYWRLVAVMGTTGNPFIRIGDLEFRDALGADLTGANGLAYADVGNAANAFDSSLSSYWDSGGLGSGEHFVGWQFDTSQRIYAVAIRPVDSEGNQLRAFRIEFSDDGVDYTVAHIHVAADGDLPNNAYTVIDFPLENKLPAGGTTGQVLVKASNKDFDAMWGEVSGGGGGAVRTPHRYWRVLPTISNGDNGYSHATEIAFRGEPGGPNLVGSGTPIASGAYSTNVAANAFDSNNATLWESQNGSVTGGTVWIGYDFGSPVDVQEVAWTLNLGYEDDERMTAGKLQWSDNGVNWNDAYVLPVAAWVGSSGYQTQVFTDPAFFDLRTETNAAIAVIISDRNKTIVGDRATAQVATIPTDANAAFKAGDTVTFIQKGAGAISVVGAAGVTVNKPADFAAAMRHRYGILTAIKIGVNEWVLTGALADA